MEQLKQKQDEFLNLARRLQDFVKSAPKEKLRIRKKGTYYQYYIEKNRKRHYISKKNITTAQKIAQRDYYKKLLPSLLKTIRAMNNFLVVYKPDNLEQIYKDLPQSRKQLVQPIFLDNETYARQWQSQKFERKKDQPDGTYQTIKAEAVRSKSEIIIANLLNEKKVPYHYEYPVPLSNGVIIHPDFFCLNKRTRQEFYWEHCGKMDDLEYTANLTQRFSEYSKCGIIPGKNLIITMETSKTPLETKAVERLIAAFLV
ncbi:MAG: hypothetical protein J6X78_10910 [Treponema sp.]|nr:hypothetical protein [Treponema sp.]